MEGRNTHTLWILLLLFATSGKTITKENTNMRIVLVGRTGAGKSATGNSILGKAAFIENNSFDSVTKQCQIKTSTAAGTTIEVVDSPGLFDNEMSGKDVKKEIAKCVNMSVPGPHAFLLVLRLDVRMTDEEKDVVRWIESNFGEEASMYTIVLFTHGDSLHGTIEDFLRQTKDKFVKRVINRCGGRYHVFNNKATNKRKQVSELLSMIKKMVNDNGGQHYTNDMYQQAQKKMKEDEERQNQEEEAKIQEMEERIKDENNKLFWCKVKAYGSVGIVATAAFFSSPALMAVGAGTALSGYNCTFF